MLAILVVNKLLKCIRTLVLLSVLLFSPLPLPPLFLLRFLLLFLLSLLLLFLLVLLLLLLLLLCLLLVV